jgi:hypothetical protein
LLSSVLQADANAGIGPLGVVESYEKLARQAEQAADEAKTPQ